MSYLQSGRVSAPVQLKKLGVGEVCEVWGVGCGVGEGEEKGSGGGSRSGGMAGRDGRGGTSK